MQQETAENLAIQALAYLATKPEKLAAFLNGTGIDPMAIRAAAREPGFLAGVLDHVAADERLLLACAAAIGGDPGLVMRARTALAGGHGAHDES